MQERRPEMRGLQAGSTRRAKATEGRTVCSVTALQTPALEELMTGNVWRGWCQLTVNVVPIIVMVVVRCPPDTRRMNRGKRERRERTHL